MICKNLTMFTVCGGVRSKVDVRAASRAPARDPAALGPALWRAAAAPGPAAPGPAAPSPAALARWRSASGALKIRCNVAK